MKTKKLFFKFLISISLLVWIALFVSILFFGYLYSEKHYIPRINFSILDASFSEELDVSLNPLSPTYSIPSPELLVSEEETIQIPIVFDKTSLTHIHLERPLLEETEALLEYARFSPATFSPKIAIVLTEVGLNDSFFETILKDLPSVVSLAFSPYSNNLNEKIIKARENGFEGLIDIPTNAPPFYTDAGEYSLSEEASPLFVENLFSKIDLNAPIIGIWNIKYKTSLNIFSKKHGMFDLSKIKKAFVLTDNFYASAIRQQLEKAVYYAKESGYAIVSLPAHPMVIKVLTSWVGLEKHDGIDVVPLSAI